MKKLFTLLAVCLAVLNSSAQILQTFHDFSGETIIGDTISYSQFYGKKVMVVNTASQCGWTYQYEGLQDLYAQYNQYGFEIIGFPSDEFNQEPGDDSSIILVCEGYNVTFQMMSKVDIKGTGAIPLYKWLQQASLNGVRNASVTWNFNKFLIDEAGHWVNHFTNMTEPMDTAITNWIMTPSVVSSMLNVDANDMFEVKPNPANSCVDCVLKNSEPQHYTIKIYSNQGQLIQTIFDGMASAQSISYPVTPLAAGLYFITVQNKVAQKTFRYTVVN